MAAPDSTLEHWVRDLRAGHDVETNFRKVFVLLHGQVYRFFQRKGVPDQDCLDLTQETFISVFKSLEDLKMESQFTNWLFVIARHTFLEYLDRKHARKRTAAVVPITSLGESKELDVADDRPDPYSTFMHNERIKRLREAMLDLPEQMRNVVMMRVTEDAPYDSIAERFGISINTVKVHLHHARKNLGRRLKPWFGETAL